MRTILETGELSDEMTADVKRAVIDETLSYVPQSNRMLLTFAENEILRSRDHHGSLLTVAWESAGQRPSLAKGYSDG